MSTDQLTDVAEGNGHVLDQPKFDKQSWLTGATDLQEGEVYVEAINDSVKVRGLTAGQLASIQTQCTTMKGSTLKFDAGRAEVLRFAAGVVEPQFSEEEANVIAHRFGESFSLIVSVIDEISRASEEDVAKAKARFRPRR